MKDRITVKHGMLPDLEEYLRRSGWTIQPTKGPYEVLRAIKADYPRPLLVYDRQGMRLQHRPTGQQDLPRLAPKPSETRPAHRPDPRRVRSRPASQLVTKRRP